MVQKEIRLLKLATFFAWPVSMAEDIVTRFLGLINRANIQKYGGAGKVLGEVESLYCWYDGEWHRAAQRLCDTRLDGGAVPRPESFFSPYFFSWTKKVTKKSRTNESSAVCPADAQGRLRMWDYLLLVRGWSKMLLPVMRGNERRCAPPCKC